MTKPASQQTSTMVAPNLPPATTASETIDRGEQLDLSTARAAAWPAADMSRPNDRHATIYGAKSSGRRVELALGGKTHALQGASIVRSLFAATATLEIMQITTFQLMSGGKELRRQRHYMKPRYQRRIGRVPWPGSTNFSPCTT